MVLLAGDQINEFDYSINSISVIYCIFWWMKFSIYPMFSTVSHV